MPVNSEQFEQFGSDASMIFRRILDGMAPGIEREKIRAQLAILENGYTLERLGSSEQATELYGCAVEHLEELFSSFPESFTACTFADVAITHGKAMIDFSRLTTARAALKRAIELLDYASAGDYSFAGSKKLARAYNLYALTQYRTADYDCAYRSYSRAAVLWFQLGGFRPVSTVEARSNSEQRFERLSLACALNGASKCLSALGDRGPATLLRREAQRLWDTCLDVRGVETAEC